MHKKYKFNIKKFLLEILGTIIGSFIIAIGVSLFLLPNQLSSGGISGIATITYYLLNIPMGTMIVIINIPLFIFAFFKIGKTFFTKAIVGTISLSIFIDLLDNYQAITTDRFLACIYGGIIIGLGTALILKMNSSTGGTDLISYIVREYKPVLKMGQMILILDAIIVSLNVIFLREIEIGLYSAIAIYIMGQMIDILFEGIYFTKLLLIISNKNEEIAKQIGDKVQRGTTGLYGIGMYKKEEKLVLMCAASRRDVGRIKLEAREMDPNCFIIITNSREVLGLGFNKV